MKALACSRLEVVRTDLDEVADRCRLRLRRSYFSGNQHREGDPDDRDSRARPHFSSSAMVASQFLQHFPGGWGQTP